MWTKHKAILVALVVGCAAISAVPANAAAGTVVINELMYNPVSDLGAEEYLELHNPGDTPVSLAGMSFTSGIAGTFGAYDLAPGEYITISPSAATTLATYGIQPILEYAGGLRNSGETITLVGADGVTVIDSVTYADVGVWPTGPDGNGPSLELKDPLSDNNVAEAWAASNTPTPGAQNSVFGLVEAGFSQPTVNPAWPSPGQSVTIAIDISNVTSANLVYRVMHGTEQTVAMARSGNTFSVTLPAQNAGDLVRYRIETDTNEEFPGPADSIDYLGYVTKKSVTTSLPTFEWFITDQDYIDLNSEESRLGPVDLFFPSVFAYEGVVYTGLQVKIHGGNWSRTNNAKQSYSFELPAGYRFDAPELFDYPVDEFAMKHDPGSLSRPEVSWRFIEEADLWHYSTFRSRLQKNGVFHAQYRIKEKYDDEWRKANNMNDGQLFKLQGAWEKKSPKDGDNSDINAVQSLLDSTPTQRELWEAFDIANVVNYWAVSAAIGHQDQASHNRYFYYDSAGTGQWRFVPWDLRHLLGSHRPTTVRGQRHDRAELLRKLSL